MIKNIWRSIGYITYMVTFPLLVIYLRIGSRTRLVVEHKDSILVVKGWLGNGKWSLPGGGLHRAEDPAIGVLRELYEETRIVLNKGQLTPGGKAELKKRIIKFNYYRYYAELSKRPPMRPQKWEIQELAWLPISSLNRNNADQSLLDTLDAFNTGSTSVTI